MASMNRNMKYIHYRKKDINSGFYYSAISCRYRPLLPFLTFLCLLFFNLVAWSYKAHANGVLIEIGLFNTACGEFEVRLKPDKNIESKISNLQFTLKWPINSVELENFYTDFPLSQQGPVFDDDGYNYAVFVSVPLGSSSEINWTAGVEYVVMTFNHDESGTADFNMHIANDQWAIDNNGEYYIELLGIDYTGGIYHEPTDIFPGKCNFAYLQVILQGAYDAAAEKMRTNINAAGNLPLTHPYNGSPWSYDGDESVTTFPDSIVDWVLVELRDPNDPSILRGRKAGLLSHNGVLMETDLSAGLRFYNETGSYYLVVKHRNHIAVMSGTPVNLPNRENPYNFTEVTITQPYKHNDPRPTVIELKPDGSGKYGMIAGNVIPDDKLIYIGPENDRDIIIELIRTTLPTENINETISGYHNADVNLDNEVKYIGPLNDRDIIIQNLGILTGSTATNVIYESVVPKIIDP